MDIIHNNLDIKKLYEEQMKEIESDTYKKYIKYLSFFYSKNNKKDKYDKEFLNSKYILIDKKNSSKKIIITPSEFIDIHKLFIKLKNYSDIFLNKIISLVETKNNINEDNRKEFDDLKEKYLLCKNKLNNIESINKDFYKEIEILLNKKIEETNKLAEYYHNRVLYYSEIKIMISEKVKNKLIKLFKEHNKKIPSLNIINKIAKDNEIPSKEIEQWFKWIESVYFYILIKNNINEINKEIIEKEEYYDLNTKYLIIKKPTIEE